MFNTLKRFTSFIFAFVLLITPTFAQETDTWSAYLLDSVNNQLVFVDNNGDFSTFDLAINEDERTSSGMIEIAPDGQIVAFCGYLNHQDGTSDYTLYVQDLATGDVLYSQAYVDDSCNVTAFNVEGTQYVVASAPQYGVTPDDGIIWRIEVFDAMTNTVVHELNSSDGLLTFDDFGSDIGFIAHVRHFEGNTMSFIAIPNVGMGLGATLPAYTWSFDGTVTENELFGYVNGAYDVNSGFAFPALDESLDSVEPSGPVPASNVVKVADASASETVYSNTDWVVLNTTWINEGRDLAIMLLEGANADDSFDVRYDLYHMETGTVSNLDQRYEVYSQIASIPNGALIVWAEQLQNDNSMTLITHFATLLDGTFSDTEFVYEAPDMGRGFAFPELIWTGQ